MKRIGLSKHARYVPEMDAVGEADAATWMVVHALRSCGRPAPRDPAFTSRLRADLISGATSVSLQGQHTRSRPRGWPLRVRPVSTLAALLLALGAVGGYMHLTTATPVSAQIILRRAAAALPTASPGQVIHQVSNVSTVLTLNRGTPRAVTVDQWVQLDGNGALLRRAAVISDTAGTLYARLVIAHGVQRIYAPQDHYIYITPGEAQPSYQWIQDPFGIAQMRQLVQSAQAGGGQNLHLLAPQTIDGAAVYVVRIDNAVPLGTATAGATMEQCLTLTVYVDTQSYAIRGLDLNEVDGASSTPVVAMRVQQFDAVLSSNIPAGTFTLNAPAGTPRWTAPAPGSAVEQAYQRAIVANTVAGAVAMPDQPALLLPGPVDGLRFHGASVTKQDGMPYTSTGYGYGAPLQGPDESIDGPGGYPLESPAACWFSIGINHAAAPGPDGRLPGQMGSVGQQPMTVTVAGQTVQAQYVDHEAPTEIVHDLVYRQGNSWVDLGSRGLSTAEFFAAVNALVDAHAHPELAAAAQREADTWQYEIKVAGMATFGSTPGL